MSNKRGLNELQEARVRELIAALRSGKYQQGREQLCVTPKAWEDEYDNTDTRYCCLGVAGKLLGLQDAELQDEKRNENADTGQFLSDENAAKFGFVFEMQTTLAKMNDWPLSFTQIADMLNAWLDELDVAWFVEDASSRMWDYEHLQEEV